ncbi:F-box family protein [Rhynchospora pubera]|uniref:F-box family protein n=1 Tax=Rhynchospora pubera TaxID=906938 RepID=A0AAV8BRU7_9POAL|nr:F-box family protein [Rhynchospora pubera]KAJ4812653.1 F-box family protein [Rhynchospora pubera]
MAAWSDLTDDVLGYITSFLPFPDHYRFGAVCKNWRSILKRKLHPPAPQLPWLVLEEENETKKRKFYSLFEGKHYSIEISELCGRYICGSSHGWLFAVDSEITAILVNPFTRECYELPPFPEYYIQQCDPFEEMRTQIVFKAILSHDPKERSDFMAMILLGAEYTTPAFWKPGNASWTVIDVPKKYTVDDIVYFKGNFYLISNFSTLSVLHLVDFDPEPKLTEVGPQIEQVGGQKYLVDFDGCLLLIDRCCEHVGDDLTNGVQCDVIEPNLEKNCLYDRRDIDGYALFLGRNSSIFVDSSQFPMCKKNSINFTHLTDSFSREEFGCHEFGIFDMITKTWSTYYPVEASPTSIGSPVWLTPNPW